jgi:hypothetical protein
MPSRQLRPSSPDPPNLSPTSPPLGKKLSHHSPSEPVLNSSSPEKAANRMNLRKMFVSSSSGNLASSAAAKLKRISTINIGKNFSKMFGKPKDVSSERVAEYLKELEKDGKSMLLFENIADEIEKMDTWSSKIFKPLEWSLFEV